nr:hypothetical protein PB20LOC_04135 [Pectobacterium parmentieri]
MLISTIFAKYSMMRHVIKTAVLDCYLNNPCVSRDYFMAETHCKKLLKGMPVDLDGLLLASFSSIENQ